MTATTATKLGRNPFAHPDKPTANATQTKADTPTGVSASASRNPRHFLRLFFSLLLAESALLGAALLDKLSQK